jgi:enamine deaminase RidA (YjgF/YER057c/UK114 family)
MIVVNSPQVRRFIPFGSHWSMGIEVPYSLAVLDRGRFWSCGQCPLDLHATPIHPGDLGRQLVYVADLIRKQFAPHGIGADRIAKLVAYVARDGSTRPEAVERILRAALGPVPLVLTIGVPNFYYPGMMVEIDVYGSVDKPWSADIDQPAGDWHATVSGFGSEIHARLELGPGGAGVLGRMLDDCLAKRGSSIDRILSAHVFLDRGLSTLPLAKAISVSLGLDAGAAVLADLPRQRAAVIDLIAGVDTSGSVCRNVRNAVEMDGVLLVERWAGDTLGLAARCVGPQPEPVAVTRRIMEVLSKSLSRHNLGFDDVLKQQTYYVGGERAEDLYANMRVRNSRYSRPGPASTGLAVHGFADPDCRIWIELLAAPRS